MILYRYHVYTTSRIYKFFLIRVYLSTSVPQMLIMSVIIALFIVVEAEELEKEYPPAVPSQKHQQVKSRFRAEGSPINLSKFPREKKWSRKYKSEKNNTGPQ